MQPDARNVFANKSIDEMISQDRNASRVASMQANQVRDRLCQAKSNFQTARESHELNMDFFGFKQLRVTISYARVAVSIWMHGVIYS